MADRDALIETLLRKRFSALEPADLATNLLHNTMPSLPPMDNRPSFTNPGPRPEPTLQNKLAADINPLTGAYGAGNALAGTAADAYSGNWQGFGEKLPLAVGALFGFGRRASPIPRAPASLTERVNQLSFDPSRVGQNTGSRAPGIFFSSDPAHASAAADLHAMRAEAPGSQRVIQAYIRPGRQGVIDLKGESGAGLPEVQREIRRMRDEGYDTVVIKNTIEASGGSGSEIAVFHPSNIRTVDKDGPGLENLKAEGFDTSNVWHHGTGAWGPK